GFYAAPIRAPSGATGPVLAYVQGTKEIIQTDKTFIVDHPMHENKYLVHACLEGPEAGVYYRGEGSIENNQNSAIIELPYYVENLAEEFTVHVTPIYNGYIRTLNSSRVNENKFTVYGEPGPFSWAVYGKRSNIEVELEKEEVIKKGDGPYTWYIKK
ncbi:MAG: hypothetical protein GTN70_04195, partial [Deltaproteobacteria bacterium]|nr:hypothetical protein [Deltaproteobacteria bacterium]